jgi:aminoglycoside phosphotransferase (APT) family kinase protein
VTSDRDNERFQALIAQFAPESRLTSVRPVTGGISAQTTALAFTRPDGRTDRVIVRQHGAVDRTRNPDIARDELRLLEIVRSHGVAAPTPIHVDASCVRFPVPVIVIGFVEGKPGWPCGETDSAIDQAARQLALIHRITNDQDLAFLPQRGRGHAEPPAGHIFDDSMQESRIREALAAADQAGPGNPPTLLHGDFWPGPA